MFSYARLFAHHEVIVVVNSCNVYDDASVVASSQPCRGESYHVQVPLQGCQTSVITSTVIGAIRRNKILELG